MSEEWRPVTDASRYEVSSLGRVRSVDRRVPMRGRYGHMRSTFYRGKILKPNFQATGGYGAVDITFDDGTRKRMTVHKLICRMFHGEAPDAWCAPHWYEVRHINGIRSDNRAENLKWGTRAENAHDTVRHGNNQWANKTHCPEGHPYDEENTIVRAGKGNRACRACSRKAWREYHERNREARNRVSNDRYHRNKKAAS